MHQSHASNTGAYRIKKKRNNYFGQDYLKDDEEVFKISIHTSLNKSPNQNSPQKKNRNNSVANKLHDYERISHRSKQSSGTKGNISSSSLSGSHKKKQQSGEIRQFSNVKQLLMIKAYDKKLFKKVTGSNEANKNFLKLGDIRNDPFRKQTFKVMIQNFKQITIRIRTGYEKVLSKILFQNTNSSAIVTLANVQPILQKVHQQSDIMCFKVKQCLQTHDSRQFRRLLLKFQTFLNASKQIQQIILIVSESKNKIDNLFKNLQKDKHLDDKVNNQRKKGIKKVRNAVKDYGDDGVEVKILDRVQSAINQMADKTLNVYSKVTGVRGLMMRIKQCLRNNKDFYQLQDIVKMTKIFKQVLNQAQSYQKFVQKFIEQDDIINDDLRKCIIRYKQEIQLNRQAVYTMQLKFISNIIQTSIYTFQANYSVCNTVDSTMTQDYQKISNLLQQICTCISDQSVKIGIKAMIRDVAQQYKIVQKLLKKLKNIPKDITLDTPNGLQTLIKIQALINDYKNRIRQIIQRQQRAYREITRKRIKKQQIQDKDLQQKYIQQLIAISKRLNDAKIKNHIQNCKAIKTVKSNTKIQQLAAEIGDVKFYKQLKILSKQITHVQNSNELGTLIQKYRTSQPIYQISTLLYEIHQMSSTTNQSNILKNIQNIAQKYKSNTKNPTILQNFIQRIYAVVINTGLDKKTAKKIDNHHLIQFPQNQHDIQSLKRDIKYLKTITKVMPHTLMKQKIIDTFVAMEQLLEGLKITQQLKWNKNNLYYVNSKEIFQQVHAAFQNCIINNKSLQISGLIKNLKQINTNLQKLQTKQKSIHAHPTRVEKVLQIIGRYKHINTNIKQNLIKLEEFQAFQSYSLLIFYLCQYLKATQQSFYATLNKNNSLLWICQYPQQTPKLSLFGNLIGLEQLKCGEIVQKYDQKNPIKPRKQQPKPKQKPINQKSKTTKKKNSDQDMDEQIISQKEQSGIVQDDLAQDINQEDIADDMQQDMPEDMDEEMVQEMEDNVVDEMGDQIPEDGSISAEIIEADDDPKVISKANKNRPSGAKSKQQLPKVTPQQIQPTTNQSNKNKLQQQSKPKQDPQQIIIKQKNPKNTFQLFKYIETLQDLQLLLQKLKNLRTNYWKKSNKKTIQNYYNKQSKTQIQKYFKQELNKFCKLQFMNQFISSIVNMQKYKQIIKQIQDIQCLKFSAIRKILVDLGIKYCCFMGVNKELIRLSIQDNDKWQAKNNIVLYLQKQLTTYSISIQKFDIESYHEALIHTSKQFQTKYQLPYKTLKISQQIKQHEKTIIDIIKMYQDYSKLPDGIDLYDVICKMWMNCIAEAELKKQIKLTDKFYDDVENIKIIGNQQNAVFYMKQLKQQANKTLKQMNQHQHQFYLIIKQLDRQKLLDCIAKLVKLYKCPTDKIISFNSQPIMHKTNPQQIQKQYQIINYLILAQNNSHTITAQLITKRLCSKPEMYAQYYKQICRILSILEVQSHIWPANDRLYICQSRDDLIKQIVKYISNGVILSIEQLQSIQEINKCIKTVNHEPLIFQYSINQTFSIMDPENNKQYHKQFIKIINDYKAKKLSKYDLGVCAFENIMGVQQQQNSIASQIFEFTQSLSLILKQKIFTQKCETVFLYHLGIQDKIQQIKNGIEKEVQLLVQIVEQPLEIKQNQPLLCLKQMNTKNQLILKWYKEYQNISSIKLTQVRICPCLSQQCKQDYLLYVGENQDQIHNYLNKLTQNYNILDPIVKKYIFKNTKVDWKSSDTVHLGKIISQICKKLVQSDVQGIKQFINQYNHVNLITKQSNNKKLTELYNKLVKSNKNKRQLINTISQLVKNLQKNTTSQKVFKNKLASLNGMDLSQLETQASLQNQKLSQIKINLTQYGKFSNWIVNCAGKTHRLQYYTLVDKYNKNDVVCILPGRSDQQITKTLKNLNLPSTFTTLQQKDKNKKIHLNEQYFTIKLDATEINKQQLLQFQQDNFDIEQTDDQHVQTLVIGIYRRYNQQQSQQVLLEVSEIHEGLLLKSKQIQMNISQFQIQSDIQLKILQVKYKLGEKITQKNIIRQKKSERHTSVSLNDTINTTVLSRWLKSQLKKLIDKKQEQFLLEQQRLRQQQAKRKAEQEAKRLAEQQANRLAEQQQAKRRAQQQQKQKAKIQQLALKIHEHANFIMDDENQLIHKQAQLHLQNICEQLTKKHIYTLDQQKLSQIASNKEIKPPHTIKQLKSIRNIQIKEGTQKTIKQVQNTIKQQQKEQFIKIAEKYLQSIQCFINTREQILTKVLLQANKDKKEGIQTTIAHQQQIMEQIRSLVGYEQTMKDRIKIQLRCLPAEEKQTLTSIYDTK